MTTVPEAEHPMWGTGDELAVASATAVAIATASDFEPSFSDLRNVQVEVWVNHDPARDDYIELLRCALLVSPSGIAVGDVLGDQQHHAAISAGEYVATIFGTPSPNPERVRVVLKSA